MPIRHLINTFDFTKEDYLKVFRIIDKIKEMKDTTQLCRGKVLAVAFLTPSTSSLASFQSAIIKLGGGWMGSDLQDTWLGAREEQLEDTLRRLSIPADLIVIRGSKIDFAKLKEIIKVPIINAMAEDDSPYSAVFHLYFLKERFKNLRYKIGFYGTTGASRPCKAFYRALSLFGAEVYEDSVIPEMGMTPAIKEEAIKRGLRFKKMPLEEFIDKVDLLYIEGAPQHGTPENWVNEFNKKVKIIGLDDIAELKKDAWFDFCEPRYLADGRCFIDKRLDEHPQRANFLSCFVPGIMGIIVYLLGVEV